MQRSSDLIGYGLEARDRAFGSIDDLLFDDAHWGLRWIVVDTGTWLPGRKVLLPPGALGRPNPERRTLTVDLTHEQIEDAPGMETDQPVSRQLEADIYSHYGWEPYWAGGFGYPAAAGVPVPGAPVAAAPSGHVTRAGEPAAPVDAQHDRPGDPHLRSVNEVTDYYVEASDGSIGHVEDFLLDETEHAIRYLVIDTRNWWPGKKVLVSPHWLRDISWSDQTAHFDTTRESIRSAPEFDPTVTVDRAYEERIYSHYGANPYWF